MDGHHPDARKGPGDRTPPTGRLTVTRPLTRGNVVRGPPVGAWSLREGHSIDQLTRFHCEQWIALAERAGTASPSFLSMATVVENLERRARREAA